MPSIARRLALTAMLVSPPLAAQLPVEVHRNPSELLASGDAALAGNKKLVFDFWRIVIDAHQAERALEFVAETHVDHGPRALSALIEESGRRPRAAEKAAPEDLVDIVAERDLVVLAFRRELLDLEEEGQTYTTTGFEMFRVEGGKIVERWTSAAPD